MTQGLFGVPQQGGTVAPGLFGVPQYAPPPPAQEPVQPAHAPEEPEQPDQEESRRAALREEIGLVDSAATQFARGALDAFLAPGALAGAYAETVGSTIGSKGLERFGRDLGRASSGKSAAEALGFILGGADAAGAERADRARLQIERQEEARPTLAMVSRIAGQSAFAVGIGAGGAGSGALKTIAANALEGAAAGAQAGYEQADAPLKDVLTYAAVGSILGGGLSAVGEGVGAGIQAAKRKVASGDLDKVFGKVQQFADERMIKTAIGNDAKTMRALTDNGKDWGRVNRVANKMREANLPNDSDEMLAAITGHADDATNRLAAVAADLDQRGLKPAAADLFNEIADQTNRLRSMGTGDAQLVADAVERQVAPLRQSLVNEVDAETGAVLSYRDPTFTDLRRFKTGLGQALKWHKRAPSISDDAMSELYGNVARKLDAAADAAGPEYGAAWRQANQDATDWLTVQSGLEEEMQRRLKNRFISPSDYGTGIAGALMTMMTSGNPIAALAGGAVSALGHKALRLGGSKIAEGLANRFAKLRVHVPLSTAGGPEGQKILQTIAKTKQFMADTAERAGQNPTVRETASEAAREVAVDHIARAAGAWDPANWRNPSPLAKVVHRSQILDQAAQEISAATQAVSQLRAPIPEVIEPARIARLMKGADGVAAIGKVQSAMEEILGSLPPTPEGSALARELRLGLDELRRADPAEAFALAHRIANGLDGTGTGAARAWEPVPLRVNMKSPEGAAAELSTADRIRQAAFEIGGNKTKNRVMLADLREQLPDLSKEQVDRELLQLQNDGKLVLYGEDNAPARTPRIDGARLEIAGNPRHLLYLTEDLPKGLGAQKEAEKLIADFGLPELESVPKYMPRPSKAAVKEHEALVRSFPATPEQADAIRKFSFGYDSTIRSLQRGVPDDDIIMDRIAQYGGGVDKRGIPHEIHLEEARKAAADLESYVATAPKAMDQPVVYRGLVGDKDFVERMLNEDIVDMGGAITSSSYDPQVARSFTARNQGDETPFGVVLKLRHRNGVGVGGHGEGRVQIEREILLPGTSKFRKVAQYADPTTPNQVIIEADEIVPGLGGFPKRASSALREALADDAFGAAGQRYRELLGTEPEALAALRDPAKLRDVLADLKESGQLSGTAEILAQQIAASHGAAKALAGWPKDRAAAKALNDWRKLVQDGESATLVDGQPLVQLFDAATDAPKPVNDTTVLDVVSAEVDKIVPVLKPELAKPKRGKFRAVPGFAAPEAMSLGEQRKLYDRHMKILTDTVTNPGQLADAELRGGPVIAAAATERLQNLINEMPKPVETIRGKQELSRDQLRIANAM